MHDFKYIENNQELFLPYVSVQKSIYTVGPINFILYSCQYKFISIRNDTKGWQASKLYYWGKINNGDEYITYKIIDFIRKGIRQSLLSSSSNAYKLSSKEITNKITRLIEYLL